MNNKITTLLIALVALPLAGCANMFPGHYGNNSSAGRFNTNTTAPSSTAPMPHYQTSGPNTGVQIATSPTTAAQPQQMFTPQNTAVQMMQSQTMSQLSGLKERVRRVERAMIRLDRRMQLIERNALSKINPEMEGEQGTLLQPMSQHLGDGNSFYNGGGYQQSYAAGFKPVAYKPASNKYITSSLQAAPPQQVATPSTSNSMFPSLADKEKKVVDAPEVSIWTINYEPRKIWPSREQLPGSRDVVEVLRDSEHVTLFARGMHASSKEFRDRVRAISRYLGRVAGEKSVSIAAMPDDNMNADVIEIIATK
jgi:hypothetical protein